MPYSINGNVKIYFELDGNSNGIPVILHTGGAGDMNMWRFAGYVKGLSRNFKVILIDHRGRGKSDKPLKLEDHKLDCYVSDIVRLMNNLQIVKSAFWGYSDGARVGFTLGSRYPDRINALIASGNYGVWNPPKEDQALIRSLRKSGTEALISELERSEGLKTPEPIRSNLLETPSSEIFALNEEAWLKWRDDKLVSDSFNTPTLFINGEIEDPNRQAEKLAEKIPNSKAITLRGLGHLGAFIHSELVLPIATKFLRDHEYR
jgi:pimeloyl-ACP methyl ester carboxylesterase